MKKVKAISAEEFDRLFDEGSDEIDQYVDWSKGQRINQPGERVHLQLPPSVVNRLDEAAAQAGMSREALLEGWIAEKLDAAA